MARYKSSLQIVKEMNDLHEIYNTLGRLEASVELVLEHMKKQNGRIGWLEKKFNYASGGLAVMTAMFWVGWEYVKAKFI